MLQVEHLSYDVLEEGKQSEILNDVSFTVNDGEMLVITGPNGGGKSTLAKLLMGINKPSSGKILLNGEDITEYTIDERAKAGIGFAFQQPPRFKGMTVRRLLSLAAGHSLDEKTCCNLLRQRRSLCHGVYRQGGGRYTFRRRNQKNRDRYSACKTA